MQPAALGVAFALHQDQRWRVLVQVQPRAVGDGRAALVPGEALPVVGVPPLSHGHARAVRIVVGNGHVLRHPVRPGLLAQPQLLKKVQRQLFTDRVHFQRQRQLGVGLLLGVHPGQLAQLLPGFLVAYVLHAGQECGGVSAPAPGLAFPHAILGIEPEGRVSLLVEWAAGVIFVLPGWLGLRGQPLRIESNPVDFIVNVHIHASFSLIPGGRGPPPG